MTNDDRSSPAIGIWTNHLITSHIVRFLQAKDVASFIRVSRLHFEAGVGTLYRTFPYRHWQKVMKWCRDPSRLEAYANAVRVVDLNASSRTIQPIYWPEILSHFPNATQIERYTDTLTRHYPSVGEVVYTFSYIYPVTLDPLNVHEKPVRPTGIPEKWKLKRPLYVKALGKDFPQSPGEQRDVAFQDTLLERVKFLQAEVEELSVTFPVANRVLADIMKRLREQGTGLTKSIAIVSVDRDFFELVNALPSTTESIAALPQEYEDAELEADEVLSRMDWDRFHNLLTIRVLCRRPIPSTLPDGLTSTLDTSQWRARADTINNTLRSTKTSHRFDELLIQVIYPDTDVGSCRYAHIGVYRNERTV